MWLKHLIFRFCPKSNFLSRRQFSQDIAQVNGEDNELYVLFASVECYFAIMNFDLWMSKRTYDVFALVIKFLSSDW